MKFLYIFILLFYIGCQDYNSNTFDKSRYGEIELNGSAGFPAAYSVLQNRCMNCHYHASWSGYTNEEDWIINNLVVAQDVANSPLIYRIINFGGASSDMPQGGQALPTAEYDALTNWVEQITP